MKKTSVSPSKTKYDHSHPVVSIRVDKELKDDLDALKIEGIKSLGDILREAVGKQLPSAKKAYKEGFDTGYACGCVFYHCSACGKLIKMSSDEERQAAAKYMEEHGWKHETCEGQD